jgi:FAD/FMN-containing dehydrogenase/Fe-S oxidoreductase
MSAALSHDARGGPAHAELAAALASAGVRDVDFSSRRRAEYSTDASLYRVLPQAVVYPRSADEVAAVLAVCRALGVALTARGAGTSIAGNAVGAGVILDYSRHLKRIRGIDPEAATAAVEPGVVLDDLQRAAARHGLRFGPDPSSHSRCTVGGMIGNNACGTRAMRYGRTADNVLELSLIAGTGEQVRAAPGALHGSATLLTALQQVASGNLAVLRTEFGRFSRQVSGYSLEHLLPERGFNAPAALTGTEGTCGLISGATLRLVRVPPATALVTLGYPDMAAAADAVPGLLPLQLVALEGLDARITAVASRRMGAAVPELPRGGGWIFAEVAGATPEEAAARAREVIASAQALAARTVTSRAEAAALWRIREDGAGLVVQADPVHPAHAGWEDAAVPPDRLGAYLREFEELMAAHGLHGAPYGHFGDGCVHVRIDFPLRAPGGRAAYRDFITAAARLVAAHGGSMSGEHGDGRARSELLPLMYSPAALSAFAAVKSAFDPDGVLNPGLIVSPVPLDGQLRQVAARPLRGGLGFAYPDDGGDLTSAVHRCTGIGRCVAAAAPAGGVMCPSYQATRDEKDSTRGRARVLQELANGGLVRSWRAPEIRESLDLCLACKGCASDCPAGVDMATYKAEALYQAYRHRPRPAAHYALGWLPRWARLASAGPRLANRVMHAPGLGRIGKRLAGVDVRRDLPDFAPVSLRQRLAVPAAGSGPPVLLWTDTFSNYFSPQAGERAARLLADAGFSVRIPRRQLCCGLTWISTGQLDSARRILRRSVGALAEHAAAGMPIIGLEPSCTAVFRADARSLLGDTPQVRAVAAAVRTLAEFLGDQPGWSPPDLSGVQVVAQPHCHHRAVLGWQADRQLLSRAGAAVTEVSGCCGLAGNFGAERGHFELSAAIAANDLLPAITTAGDGAVIVADGFSCRTQISQLAGRRALHLAELLAGEHRQDHGGAAGDAARDPAAHG